MDYHNHALKERMRELILQDKQEEEERKITWDKTVDKIIKENKTLIKKLGAEEKTTWKKAKKLLEKMTFAAVQSVQDGDPIDETIYDAGSAGGDYIGNDNNIGGNILTAQTVNEGRYSMFEQYKDDIQGFQYSAILDDHCCDLCAELDGDTFETDDAESLPNTPPQHAGCRCIIVPILNDDPTPDEWDGLDADPEMIDKYQTLAEVHK